MAMLNAIAPQQRAPVDIARDYVDAGIPVFPCRESNQEGIDQSTGEIVDWPEKSPYTSNGLRGASRSHRIIDILFGDRHPSAAIGAPTGEPMGAWVLDLDRHGDRDGHVWLAEMEALHGLLPDTGRATTANGGTHIFFSHVAGVRNRAAIAPGVDTRGDGGYVLAPGSQMADGRQYRWIDHDGPGLPPLKNAPQWLLDLVIAKAPEQGERQGDYTYTPGGNAKYVDRAMEDECRKVAGASTGNRGQQLYSSACALGEFVAAGALSRDTVEDELYAAACASGVAAKDGRRATLDRIKRGLDKTRSSPREIPEQTFANDNTTPVDPSIVERLLKNHQAKQQPASDEGDQPEEQTVQQPKKRDRFEKTWFHEIKEGEPKETFIKGVLGNREFTTISGLPGTGKSVITTDAACHVAAGLDWHGRKVKQGLVVYVAAERKKLTERRMMAFRQRHSVDQIPLLVLGGRLDFTRDLKDSRDLIAAIKEAETETGFTCVWVIVDTLTRVFGAGDQNASKDMSRFVQSCDEILAETSAHVTAIHHSGWSGERGKGAIDLDGAVDASFMVKKTGNSYKLVCDGTNDGEEGDIVSFTMDSVCIGHDEDGEPTTAPVVVQSASETKLTSGALKGFKLDVFRAISAAVKAGGIEPDGSAFPENILVVDEKAWRAEFYAGRDMTDTSGVETARKQFKRASEALTKEGLVNNIGLWFWPS